MKKILITGVCGLIGSHLAQTLLRRGDRVIGIDNLSYGTKKNIQDFIKHPKFSFHNIDICDSKKLGNYIPRVDYVLHMAAVKKIGESDAAFPTLNVNAFGTQSVLQACVRTKPVVVIGSTSDVYGSSREIPFSEKTASLIGASTAKRWAYAVSKLYAEHIALAYHKDQGVPVVVLRYFGCFSERSSKTWSGGHVPIFVDRILRGEEIVIHGDGKQTRSMAHVSDIVRGTIAAMDTKKAQGEIINLGNDEECSVLQSAKLIHKLSKVKHPLKIKFVPMRKVFGDYQEIPRRIPDLRKASKILGYKPRIKFKKALLMTIEEARKH